MKEEERFIIIARKLRVEYNLTQTNIDTLAGFYERKYSKIEKGKQVPSLDDVKCIAKVYGMTTSQILELEIDVKAKRKLPEETMKYVKSNRSNLLKENKAWNKTAHVIIALGSYKLGQTFINSEIVENSIELSSHMKNAAISWTNKDLKDYAERTGQKRKNLNKGKEAGWEIEYRVIKEVTPEVLKEVQEKIAKAKAEKEAVENDGE